MARFTLAAARSYAPFCAGAPKGEARALTDSASGKVIREYSIEELKDAANLMRGYNLVALHAAGSGHAGGPLSILDIAAALYLKVANHDPKNPNWTVATKRSFRRPRIPELSSPPKSIRSAHWPVG
jgi:hypothetical protein